jgi:hypothetical protein
MSNSVFLQDGKIVYYINSPKRVAPNIYGLKEACRRKMQVLTVHVLSETGA